MADNNIKYSIVVPIYNVQRFLEECVESLINQTYRNIEIILVDDGSPDNSPMICDEYAKKDERITVIHKPNGGLVSARKAGAKATTGSYVFCVDGDDYVSLDMVERVDEIVRKTAPDVVCFGFFRNNQDNPLKVKFPYGLYDRNQIIKQIFPHLIEDKNAKYFPNNLCGKAIKRDIYISEQLLVDDKIKIGEDLVCTKPIISKISSLFIMEECLYFYRINNCSMTKNKKPFDWEVPSLIYEHLKNNLDQSEYDFSSQLDRNVVHNVFNVVVSQFYRNSERVKDIKRDIKHNLSKNKIYLKSIKRARYSSIKGIFMINALRYSNYFLMQMYAKMK